MQITPVVNPGARIVHGASEDVIGPMLDSAGFGTVYTAERTKRTTTDVVVMAPAGHGLTDPEFAQKFERKAQILANIRDESVVHVVASGSRSTAMRALMTLNSAPSPQHSCRAIPTARLHEE